MLSIDTPRACSLESKKLQLYIYIYLFVTQKYICSSFLFNSSSIGFYSAPIIFQMLCLLRFYFSQYFHLFCSVSCEWRRFICLNFQLSLSWRNLRINSPLNIYLILVIEFFWTKSSFDIGHRSLSLSLSFCAAYLHFFCWNFRIRILIADIIGIIAAELLKYVSHYR